MSLTSSAASIPDDQPSLIVVYVDRITDASVILRGLLGGFEKVEVPDEISLAIPRCNPDHTELARWCFSRDFFDAHFIQAVFARRES